MVIISDDCSCQHTKSSDKITVPRVDSLQKKKPNSNRLWTTSYYDCSHGCLDTGSGRGENGVMAPRALAPFEPPETYRTENKENLWLVGAASPEDGKWESERSDNFEDGVLNDYDYCGKCILYKMNTKDDDDTVKPLSKGSAIAMFVDSYGEGESQYPHQLDQAVPGWDDSKYSQAICNCPKNKKSENYETFGLTIDQAAGTKFDKDDLPDEECKEGVTDKKFNSTNDSGWAKGYPEQICENIDDVRLKYGCKSFLKWTNSGFTGDNINAIDNKDLYVTFENIKCPSQFVDLVNNAALAEQDETSQKKVMDAWCKKGGGCPGLDKSSPESRL